MFSCEIPASVWNRFCWRWARRELFRKKPPRESRPLRVRHDGGQQASAGKEPGEKYETRFGIRKLGKNIYVSKVSAVPRHREVTLSLNDGLAPFAAREKRVRLRTGEYVHVAMFGFS